MSKEITRKEMVEAVEKTIASYKIAAENPIRGKGSFAHRGAKTRLHVAQRLLRHLQSGGVPSTQQVVGYFGKGARWADE